MQICIFRREVMFFFPNSYTFSIFLILKILKLKIQKIAQAILEPYPNTA